MHTCELQASVRAWCHRQENTYSFLHDRVQEAAYSLIPERSRTRMHLRLGRLLASGLSSEAVADRIFEVVSQLNRGIALIIDEHEREHIAELNLFAGKRAQESTAYASALTYLTTGAVLLRRIAGNADMSSPSRWNCAGLNASS